jgi:hypothetical protein
LLTSWSPSKKNWLFHATLINDLTFSQLGNPASSSLPIFCTPCCTKLLNLCSRRFYLPLYLAQARHILSQGIFYRSYVVGGSNHFLFLNSGQNWRPYRTEKREYFYSRGFPPGNEPSSLQDFMEEMIFLTVPEGRKPIARDKSPGKVKPYILSVL